MSKRGGKCHNRSRHSIQHYYRELDITNNFSSTHIRVWLFPSKQLPHDNSKRIDVNLHIKIVFVRIQKSGGLFNMV